MKKICLFSSFSTRNTVDNYVKFYLQELRRFNDQVIFITNTRPIIQTDVESLQNMGIEIQMVENEGYDFGMWYKVLLTMNHRDIGRLMLVNDSCILFRKLDTVMQWMETQSADYLGLTNGCRPAEHIQSYFLVIKKPCIETVFEYFKNTGIKKEFLEVILTYEVGLSQYIKQSGYSMASMRDYRHYALGVRKNIVVYYAKHLIADSFPLIKKKVINGYYDTTWHKWLVQRGCDIRFNFKKYLMVNFSNNVEGMNLNMLFGDMNDSYGYKTSSDIECAFYRYSFLWYKNQKKSLKRYLKNNT